jgi:hypothetical protein
VIARWRFGDYGQPTMSDRRTFDQALRALDKFIAEHQQPTPPPAETKQPVATTAATPPR